jgi:hypothetical protein
VVRGDARLLTLQRTIGNRALARLLRTGARVLQRLKAEQIVVGKAYQYNDRKSGTTLTGKLVKVSGAWYTFENGNCQGSAQVLSEVAEVEEMMVDEVKEDVGGASASVTLVDVIEKVAAEQGLTGNDNVLSVVVERTLEQLKFLQGEKILESYVSDPKAIASCMQTADALLPLFATEKVSSTQTAERTSKGMEGAAKALAASIGRTAGHGSIHHIIYGIHGFTVVARGDHAELLQSFASGEAPETLAFNFHNQRGGSLDTVGGWLTDMAGPEQTGRAGGQTMISGDPELEPATVLEDAENMWPNVRFEWKVAMLASEEEIVTRLQKRIEENLKLLEGEGLVKR